MSGRLKSKPNEGAKVEAMSLLSSLRNLGFVFTVERREDGFKALNWRGPNGVLTSVLREKLSRLRGVLLELIEADTPKVVN